MSLSVCPIANVAAPVELVWKNLVEWENYAGWADVYVEHMEPEGPASVGQTIHFAGKAFGSTWRFTFKVEEVVPEKHQLGLYVYFPFGLQERPHITCTPVDATTCRVQYG